MKSVVKNANEILQGALLGLEAAWSIGERSFNMGENPGTPGMSGSGPSKNVLQEDFLSEETVLKYLISSGKSAARSFPWHCPDSTCGATAEN